MVGGVVALRINLKNYWLLDIIFLFCDRIPHVHNMLVEALQLTPTLRVASLH